MPVNAANEARMARRVSSALFAVSVASNSRDLPFDSGLVTSHAIEDPQEVPAADLSDLIRGEAGL